MNAEPDFEPGQIWTYHGAELASSRVLIGVVGRMSDADDAPLMAMVAITDVLLPDPKTGEVGVTEIGSAPIEVEFLKDSTVICEGVGQVPDDLLEAYAEWRSEYDSGEAGAFALTVAGVVEVVREIAAHHAPSSEQGGLGR